MLLLLRKQTDICSHFKLIVCMFRVNCSLPCFSLSWEGGSIYQLIMFAFQQSYIRFHNSVHQNRSEDLAENMKLNQFCDKQAQKLVQVDALDILCNALYYSVILCYTLL